MNKSVCVISFYLFLTVFKDCLMFIFSKDLSFAIAFCITKYLFTCCDILTDDECKVRNIFYHAVHCSFMF